MIEIVYGDNRELASLAGKTVAEVREIYEPEFDIPDRAEAVLNGKPIKKNLESETRLDEGDELCFADKKRSRAPMLVTALLLALAVTSGVFAYTFTTASVTLTVTGSATDFAAVTAENATGITWALVGRHRGAFAGGTLFNVTPATAYNGDIEVSVYLSNMDELTTNYRFFFMRLQFVDSGNVTADAEGITQLLTLENGVASFYCDNLTPGTTYYVKLLGGAYMTYPGVAGWTKKNPVIYAQVTQAG